MKYEFIADRPALNFVATVAERGTTNLDGLSTPADLARWVRQSGLVDDVGAVSAAEFDHAVAVREALFGLIAALIDQRPVPVTARRLVNDTAAHPDPRIELTARNTARRSGDLASVLSALARDAIDLAASADRHLLRWCDDERCTRPFIDRSRGQRRRWCGMAGCGDRAKAAAYRQRQRAQPA